MSLIALGTVTTASGGTNMEKIRAGQIVAVTIFETRKDNLCIVVNARAAQRRRLPLAYLVNFNCGFTIEHANLVVLRETNARGYDAQMAAIKAYSESLTDEDLAAIKDKVAARKATLNAA
jgi:hypothetical protein